MRKLIYVCLIGGMLSHSVMAADSIIFACFTKNAKQIAIVESNGHYEYSFGKPGKPELYFSNTVAEVEQRSQKWNGVGATYWEEYNLQNGDYSYVVYKAVDRMTEEHKLEGGVTVSKNGKELATVKCEYF
ncbi:hypothetical protein ACFFHT_04420 [Gallibacterium melopsittaci]|uniref:Uncharacterized protein n=1 Tax=Gallibacterium melopsittaci TaxID=516063 RepID=A0ABV6HV96_9PAST